MTIEQLANLGEFIGFLAALATLIYLVTSEDRVEDWEQSKQAFDPRYRTWVDSIIEQQRSQRSAQ